jgi:uncharacterized protein YbcI
MDGQLTRAVVRLFRERVGRGPTVAHTYVGPDMAVVVLRQVATTIDRTLTAHGRATTVRAVRAGIRDAMRDELCEIVADVTGREVEQMLSDYNTEHDTSVLVFLFVGEAS